ncbi:hypothetical protein ACHQM5_026096 [Ranunculus cassubicifolius]
MMFERPPKHNTPFSCIQIAKEYSVKEAKDKNFVFSPYSIQLGLSLLTNGSTGSTKTELLNFLEAENLDNLNSKSEQVLQSLCKTKKGDSVLSLVGGVWIDQSLTIKPSFQDNAAKVYKAKAETVDFKDEAKSNKAMQKVNRWAEESTNGLIKSVVPEDFDPSRKIILANALYFKGRWSSGFSSKVTRDKKFYLLGGNSLEVPFMSSRLDQQIGTFADFKILRLDYDSKSWEKSMSMYILLPNERDGLLSLIDMVGSDPLFIEKCTSGLEEVRVGEFMIPKFKIEYGFDAKEALKKIGLKSTFTDSAILDEIAHGANCPVNSVIHKAYIDVNEEGTEAAGVTVIMHYSMSLGSPPRPTTEVDFVADHPFMFMVRDDVNGSVLFMGHVVNPLLQ